MINVKNKQAVKAWSRKINNLLGLIKVAQSQRPKKSR